MAIAEGPRGRHRLAVCVLLALGLTCRPAFAVTPSYERYGDWLLACSNILTCEAKGFESGQQDGPDLRVIRFAGDDDIGLEIDAPYAFAVADLRIDSKPLALDAKQWEIKPEEGFTRLISTDPAGARAFLTQMRGGTSLTVGKLAIPLGGVTAALLRMDDRQGRVGGITALASPSPTSRLPPPPKLPLVQVRAIDAGMTIAEQQRQVALVRSSQRRRILRDQCSVVNSSTDDAAYALGNGKALVFVACFSGAYQSTSYVFIVPRGRGAPATMFAPTIADIGVPGPIEQLTTPGFDPEKGTLSMLQKLRGPGDCGMFASWQWDGAAFRQSSVSYQDACGGSAPADWPSLFESRGSAVR